MRNKMRTAIQASIPSMLFKLSPVLIIIGIVNTIDIEAATYYVSTSGNNANSCATAQGMDASARRNVAQGLACLGSGDTLRIQAGTYNSSSDVIDYQVLEPPSGSAGAPTIIEANPGDIVTLRSNNTH